MFRSNSGACAAFLANNDPSSAVRVTFNGFPYDLPAWSISVLPDCKTVTFNTAKVRFSVFMNALYANDFGTNVMFDYDSGSSSNFAD